MSVQGWTGTDERSNQSNVCKLIFEGMVTIFIVLVFMFIAQNWVLINTEEAPVSPTCSLSDRMVEGGWPIATDKAVGGYKLIRQ